MILGYDGSVIHFRYKSEFAVLVSILGHNILFLLSTYMHLNGHGAEHCTLGASSLMTWF